MKIHYIQATLDGCSLVQCVLPCKYINRLGEHTATLSKGQESIERDSFEAADVLVFQRQIRNSMFQELKKYKGHKLLVYDLDDNMWGLEKSNPSAPEWPPEKVHFIELFIEQCDLITTHSEEVCRLVKAKYPHKAVEYMLPMVDLEEAVIVPNTTDTVRVGWIGSSSHRAIMEDIIHAQLGALKRVDNITDVWFGHLPDNVGDINNWWRYEFYPWVPREQFYKVLGALQLDIGIAPLAPNSFARTRSLRKVLDYGIFGVPTVVTDYGPFSSIPDDVVYKINSHNRIPTWMNAIMDLANDKEARQELSTNIRAWVAQFDGALQAPKWIGIYELYNKSR